MPLLEAKEISSGYGDAQVLYEVSLEVEQNEIVSIIGPNGSGKSTLLKSIFGVVKPWRGKIIFHNTDITGIDPNKVARYGLSYVPQEDNIFSDLSVRENLEIGAYIQRESYHQRLEKVFETFSLLKEKVAQKVRELSGGQQKMVAIGRALMLSPKALILDEPTAGLAPKLAKMILGKIDEINKVGPSILLVEQNAREALKLADRGLVLAMGEKKFEGTGEHLLQDEKIRELYLGG